MARVGGWGRCGLGPFSYLDLYAEIVLPGPLRRPAVPEPTVECSHHCPWGQRDEEPQRWVAGLWGQQEDALLVLPG